MPTMLDLALALIACVLWPLYENLIEWPRFKRALRAGVPGTRARGYWKTIAWQWLLTAAVLAAWFAQGRGLPALGLGWAGGTLAWVMAALAVAGAAFMWLQTRSIAASAAARAQVREGVAALRDVMPHDRGELNVFRVLSVTAGVCEEILFRGFLTWVIASFAGVWAGVLGSAALFGLAHAYQGAPGIAKTSVVGLVMSGVVAAAGSLWPAMLLHAAVDWGSGEAGRLAIESEGEPSPEVAAAAGA